MNDSTRRVSIENRSLRLQADFTALLSAQLARSGNRVKSDNRMTKSRLLSDTLAAR